MEHKTIYYISEAAKKVQVESHVLRYWEEELQLPIGRNEMGHRCYTEQDIKQLQEIKLLKEQGLQLKAIRTILLKNPGMSNSEVPNHILTDDSAEVRNETGSQVSDNKTEIGRDKLMEMVKERMEDKTKEKEEMLMNRTHKYVVALSNDTKDVSVKEQINTDMGNEKNQKAARLQYLLQHMITEAVKSANRELCTEVKDSILKELDYQFRMQEERDEQHWKQEEEHYRKIDEMIRERHKVREKLGRGRKKV